jgi:tRNA(Ile)-lysidine synthetase-like protein
MMCYSIPMTIFNELINKKCIILVSGGPDSMALVHMAMSHKLDIVLVSVNYHMRETSQKDIDMIQSFALKHQLPCHIFDAYDLKGNFQAKARDFRYQKAMDVATSVGAEVILTAHHLDDHIETYLWQLKRNHKPLHYGIKTKTWLKEFMLIRPFLNMSKSQLIEYNKKHDVPYVIDESNTSLKYTRNVIRQQCLTMSESEKDKILKELNEANQKIDEIIQSFMPHITKQEMNVEWFKTLNEEHQHICLRVFLNEHKAIKATKDALDQFCLHLDHKDYHQFFAPVYLLVHHGMIKVFSPLKPLHQIINSKTDMQNADMSMFTQSLKTLPCAFFEEDFPIVLRFAKPKDRMQIKVGRKKVFNWFSEKKIPRIARQTWPVIENAQREIIYVKGWGADLVHRTNIQ